MKKTEGKTREMKGSSVSKVDLPKDRVASPVEKKVKRVFFDIVNSVKGGSGKSTISLLLAAYCSSDEYFNDSNMEEIQKRKAVAYILDLDLKGTSWEKNYGRYITTQYFEPLDKITLREYYIDSTHKLFTTLSSRNSIRYHQYPFFNTIMKDYKSFKSKSFWSGISFQTINGTTSSDVKLINICPASSTSGESINQIEVDIFENFLLQLILEILNSHLLDTCSVCGMASDSNADDIHIILDMPPSYEQHAEAVIKHLLTNSNSELYQKAKDKEGPFKKNTNNNYYEPYVINFFMPCSVSNAHIEQNGIYLWDWFQNVHYSEGILYMLETARTRIRYIINDISDYYNNLDRVSYSSSDEWLNDIYNQLRIGGGSLYYNKVQDFILKKNEMPYRSPTRELRFMTHLNFPGAASLFLPNSMIAERPPLQIDFKYLASIKNVAADLFFL